MKKSLIMVLVLCMLVAVVGIVSAHILVVVGTGGQEKITTDRSINDYKAALKELSGADKVGDIIAPERDEIKYLFVPLYKGGELIGYGSWVNLIIYNHPEDMVAYVSPDGKKIVKFKALDANDYHPEMKDEKYIGKFFGMTLDTSFNPKTDVISGSTFSSTSMFFEMRNMLVVAQDYIINAAK